MKPFLNEVKVIVVYNANYFSYFTRSWCWKNSVFDLIIKSDVEPTRCRS